jgi:hypothetical protein
MIVEAILITIGGATIIWSFWWSRNERRRKAKAIFVTKLKDEVTLEELKTKCETQYGIKIDSITVDGIRQHADGQVKFKASVMREIQKAISERYDTKHIHINRNQMFFK